MCRNAFSHVKQVKVPKFASSFENNVAGISRSSIRTCTCRHPCRQPRLVPLPQERTPTSPSVDLTIALLYPRSNDRDLEPCNDVNQESICFLGRIFHRTHSRRYYDIKTSDYETGTTRLNTLLVHHGFYYKLYPEHCHGHAFYRHHSCRWTRR